MNVSGKIVIHGIEVPTTEKKIEAIEIEYTVDLKVSEIVEGLNIIDTLPAKLDALVELAQKVETYRDVFKPEQEDLDEDSILNDLSDKELKEKANRDRMVLEIQKEQNKL